MKVSEIILQEQPEQIGMYHSADEWEKALEDYVVDRFKVDGIQDAVERGSIKFRAEKKSAEEGLVLRCFDSAGAEVAKFAFSDDKGSVGG